MTEFDPVYVRGVMERRQAEKNRQAADLLMEKFKLQLDGVISYWGSDADALDKRVHALWDEADSYDPVLTYLDGRIWEAKTFEEKVHSLLEDWGYANVSVETVADVIEARDLVQDGYRVF